MYFYLIGTIFFDYQVARMKKDRNRSYRLVVLHLGKKLKLKKLKQNQNSSKKLPINSRKSSQNSNYRKFFLQHCILYFYEGRKGHFSRIFHPKTRIFCTKLNNSSENFKIFFEKLKDFCKNSRNFSKNSVYRKIYSLKLP